jgi:NADH-quinone oxidoreductase subunit L
MHRKFWVDELYGYTVIPFTRGAAKFLYWIDDVWVIDPIVDAIGRVSIWFAGVCARFDEYVIDGAINAFAWMSDRAGSLLRNTQNGQVQVYLMVVVVSITIWLLLYALPLILTLV